MAFLMVMEQNIIMKEIKKQDIIKALGFMAKKVEKEKGFMVMVIIMKVILKMIKDMVKEKYIILKMK